MLNSIRENIQRRFGIENKKTVLRNEPIIENLSEFSGRFRNWRGDENLQKYPFVENTYAPFTPLKRALPLLNLALISSAGAYIDGTEPFESNRKTATLISAKFHGSRSRDLLYAARGYDTAAVRQDRNVLIPV
jgi:hypothetical protein